MSLTISKKACICAFLCPLVFLSAQRFSLPSVAPLICFITLCFSLLEFNNQKYFNTILFITLFISVDISLPGYTGTPTILRYFIYFSLFFAIFRSSKISLNNGIIGIGILIFYITLTLSLEVDRNLTQLKRDVLILFLFIAVFSLYRPRFELDFDIISITFITFLASELINFFILKTYWFGHYMSYDSTKFLVTLPTFYLIHKNFVFTSFLVIILTELVLLGYSSRNIFVLYNVLIFCCLIGKLSWSNRIFFMLGFLAVITVSLPVIANHLNHNSNDLLKPMEMLNTIINNYKLLSYKLLDPVRYYESVMFFEQNKLRVLFGSGLGATLSDTKDYLSFVTYTDTAFSKDELISNVFYNFHDVWVDIGTRFGLVSLILVLIWILFRGIGTSDHFLVAISFMAIFTGFFSVSGLIAAAIIILSLSSRRYV